MADTLLLQLDVQLIASRLGCSMAETKQFLADAGFVEGGDGLFVAEEVSLEALAKDEILQRGTWR